MDEQIELVVEPKEERRGVPPAVAVSLVVHVLLVIGLIRGYRPIRSDDRPVPMARYVELIKANPSKQFTEAPGPHIEKPPSPNALWSDANRRASMPKPTGDKPTMRPGDGRQIYTPPSQSSHAAQPQPQVAPQQAQPQQAAAAAQSPLPPDISNPSSSRMPALQTTKAAAAGEINWRSVVKEVGKVATLGGGQNLDLSKIGGEGGGEKGFAEQGPLSFETQWYDWGEYAQSMVNKIRLHWNENMPGLIRTGMKGVVTIRFTIQRSGKISDVTILSTSTVPPYDNAAQKAIELSSPLKPLPDDFPNPFERVTCMFFYNTEPPAN